MNAKASRAMCSKFGKSRAQVLGAACNSASYMPFQSSALSFAAATVIVVFLESVAAAAQAFASSCTAAAVAASSYLSKSRRLAPC